MGSPNGFAPNCSEGEAAWIVTEVPSTTAAPATSEGTPAALNNAAPRTASKAPPPPATEPQPVAIGFGSVRAMVSWAVPSGGALPFKTFRESGVPSPSGNAARDPHGATALSRPSAARLGLNTGPVDGCCG